MMNDKDFNDNTKEKKKHLGEYADNEESGGTAEEAACCDWAYLAASKWSWLWFVLSSPNHKTLLNKNSISIKQNSMNKLK